MPLDPQLYTRNEILSDLIQYYNFEKVTIQLGETRDYYLKYKKTKYTISLAPIELDKYVVSNLEKIFKENPAIKMLGLDDFGIEIGGSKHMPDDKLKEIDGNKVSIVDPYVTVKFFNMDADLLGSYFLPIKDGYAGVKSLIEKEGYEVTDDEETLKKMWGEVESGKRDMDINGYRKIKKNKIELSVAGKNYEMELTKIEFENMSIKDLEAKAIKFIAENTEIELDDVGLEINGLKVFGDTKLTRVKLSSKSDKMNNVIEAKVVLPYISIKVYDEKEMDDDDVIPRELLHIERNSPMEIAKKKIAERGFDTSEFEKKKKIDEKYPKTIVVILPKKPEKEVAEPEIEKHEEFSTPKKEKGAISEFEELPEEFKGKSVDIPEEKESKKVEEEDIQVEDEKLSAVKLGEVETVKVDIVRKKTGIASIDNNKDFSNIEVSQNISIEDLEEAIASKLKASTINKQNDASKFSLVFINDKKEITPSNKYTYLNQIAKNSKGGYNVELLEWRILSTITVGESFQMGRLVLLPALKMEEIKHILIAKYDYLRNKKVQLKIMKQIVVDEEESLGNMVIKKYGKIPRIIDIYAIATKEIENIDPIHKSEKKPTSAKYQEMDIIFTDNRSNKNEIVYVLPLRFENAIKKEVSEYIKNFLKENLGSVVDYVLEITVKSKLKQYNLNGFINYVVGRLGIDDEMVVNLLAAETKMIRLIDRNNNFIRTVYVKNSMGMSAVDDIVRSYGFEVDFRDKEDINGYIAAVANDISLEDARRFLGNIVVKKKIGEHALKQCNVMCQVPKKSILHDLEKIAFVFTASQDILNVKSSFSFMTQVQKEDTLDADLEIELLYAKAATYTNLTENKIGLIFNYGSIFVGHWKVWEIWKCLQEEWVDINVLEVNVVKPFFAFELVDIKEKIVYPDLIRVDFDSTVSELFIQVESLDYRILYVDLMANAADRMLTTLDNFFGTHVEVNVRFISLKVEKIKEEKRFTTKTKEPEINLEEEGGFGDMFG